MSDFYVFGDSFGEPGAESHRPGIYWYDIMKSLGIVHNYCLGCTGPQRNMKLLLEKKLKNTNIIFLSSLKYRLPFPFSKERDHAEDFKNIYDTRSSPRKEVNYALEHQREIDLIYNMFGDEIEMSTFMCILYLHFYALKNNCKILIFLCDRDDYVTEDHLYFNSERFKVHKDNLFHVSIEEFKGNTPSSPGPVDDNIERHRVSHISDCNHKIMFNIISNFFTNTSLDETFHLNLYDPPKDQKESQRLYQESLNKFIYE